MTPATTPAPVPGKATAGPAAPKLLDLLRERIRLRHYSIRTETQYVHYGRAIAGRSC